MLDDAAFTKIIEHAIAAPPATPAARPRPHPVIDFARGTAWWLLAANLTVLLILLLWFLAHVQA